MVDKVKGFGERDDRYSMSRKQQTKGIELRRRVFQHLKAEYVRAEKMQDSDRCNGIRSALRLSLKIDWTANVMPCSQESQ